MYRTKYQSIEQDPFLRVQLVLLPPRCRNTISTAAYLFNELAMASSITLCSLDLRSRAGKNLKRPLNSRGSKYPCEKHDESRNYT